METKKQTVFRARCNKGHEYERTWEEVQQGIKCPLCRHYRQQLSALERERRKEERRLQRLEAEQQRLEEERLRLLEIQRKEEQRRIEKEKYREIERALRSGKAKRRPPNPKP